MADINREAAEKKAAKWNIPYILTLEELLSRLEALGMHMIGNHFTREMFSASHAAAFQHSIPESLQRIAAFLKNL